MTMKPVMTGELKMQLTQSKRDDLRSLLESHQRVTDALFNHGKPAFVTTILVLDEKNDDSTEVEVHASVARKALIAHLEWVNEELKKFGVEIGTK